MWKENGLDHFESEEEDIPPFAAVELPEGTNSVNATIPGSVWKLQVAEGDAVQKGQDIAVLESMKMEFPIKAEADGVVVKVYVKPGDKVDGGQVLAAIRS